MELYDRIGTSYLQTRHPDPRLACVVWGALGDAETGTSDTERHRDLLGLDALELAHRAGSPVHYRSLAGSVSSSSPGGLL